MEDDPATRALMVAWLDAEGYDVRAASNGREALTLLLHEAPSLMLVDLNMPVMDGAELRRRRLQSRHYVLHSVRLGERGSQRGPRGARLGYR